MSSSCGRECNGHAPFAGVPITELDEKGKGHEIALARRPGASQLIEDRGRIGADFRQLPSTATP